MRNHAATAITLLLAAASTACGEKPAATPAAAIPEWTLERVRDEGSPGDVTLMESGLRAREHVVCDGPRSKCENDPPLRIPHQHVALEVTQDGRSALFSMAPDARSWIAAFDETTVFVVDDPEQKWNPGGLRHRLLRADGTEVPLKLVVDPVPAVPGPDVLVVRYSTDVGPESVQHAFLVDERNGTLRPLDVRRNAELGFAGRFWGPNTDEFLWFVYVDCSVHWVTDGVLERRRLDCADEFEAWAGGDFTYVHDELFPDGWPRPGRMAALERTDGRLILHVSLDRGSTWRRIRVRDEAAVTDTLRQIG